MVLSSDTVLAHHPLDPLAANDLALGTDARRAVSSPVVSMNPLDIAQETLDWRSCAGPAAGIATRNSLTATRSAPRT
jgi:hypothetical protein